MSSISLSRPRSGVVRGLLAMGWCLLVPVIAVVGYFAIGLTAAELTGVSLVGTCAVAVVSFLVVVTLRAWRPSWFAYAPQRSKVSTTPHLWWSVAGLVALAFLAGQTTALWFYMEQGSDGFDQTRQIQRSIGAAAAAAFVLVVAPIGEEALFRGFVYPLLRRRVGIVISVTISAGVFALIHGNIVQFVAALPMAIVSALVYEWTRRLLPCVLIHLGFNAAATFIPPVLIALIADPVGVISLLAAFVASLVLFVMQTLRRSDEDEGARA